MTLAEFLDAIAQENYAKVIGRARELRAQYKAGKINKNVYQAFKEKHLEAVTPAGTFAPVRQVPCLAQHSGLVIGDVDDLANPDAVRHRLADDPHIVFAFISPGGDGLKVGCCIPPQSDAAGHRKAWFAFADHLGAKYGLSLDPSGKDVNRLCYVSADPHVYRNPNAMPLLILQGDRPRKQHSTGQKPGDVLNTIADQEWWQAFLEQHGWAYSDDDPSNPSITYWTRPGKEHGISASLGWQPAGGNGQLWLYVWTDNAPPLTPGWHSQPLLGLCPA